MYQNFLYNGTTDCDWQSYHLFSNQHLDDVLVLVIIPLLDEFYFDKKDIVNFFFIRYWEDGPHIRLRFKILETSKKEIVVNNILSYLHTFSLNSIKNNKGGARPILASIHEKIYEPEYVRYGGMVGILFAEQFFQLSSLTITNVFKQIVLKDVSEKIALAIQMHWAFNKVFLRKQGNEILEIYSYALKNWLSSSVIRQSDVGKDYEYYILAFDKSFNNQKNSLISMIEILNCEIENPDPDWLNIWKSGLQKLGDSFIMLENHLNNQGVSKQYIWHIIDSYIHMTNNRLGIDNLTEAYICYIITKLLEEATLQYTR